MNKTDLLLQMLEHPHDYSAAEWQQILEDDECRELYELMAKTRGALDAARACEQLTDEQIDAEWQRLESDMLEVKREPSDEHPHSRLSFSIERIRRIAAVFIAAIMLSGIALAAIHIVRQQAADKTKTTAREMPTAASRQPVVPADTVRTDTAAVAETVVFDNVPLDSIAKRIAAYHHLPMEIENDEARQLRFYFAWNQKDGLQEVVEKLNMFEHVTMVVENGKLIVR
jgi:ferric-dicitrate binding protein FerR (iron transport regulator)